MEGEKAEVRVFLFLRPQGCVCVGSEPLGSDRGEVRIARGCPSWKGHRGGVGAQIL